MKSTGSWYLVLNEEGCIVECRIRGKFRMKGLNLTNPIAVGDWVNYVLEEEGKGTIMEILPRTNYVIRQSPRQKHHHHLIASNLDQALVIVTLKDPDLKVGFIDRFLLMTEPQDIPATIVFNKSDLYDEEDRELYHALEYTYKKIGYDVLLVSSMTKEGREELREKLKDKVTLISGQSGVGKSSLVNALQPQLDLRTLEISDYSGKGQHTTTFAEMHPLDFGGFIIDTPGIKTLSFLNMTVQDVAHNFREFFAMSPNCRFRGDCTHRNEPGCAVKEAVEALRLSPVRYQNYLSILEEIEGKNYWEIVD
jgi:ribosome biogenesis GTPase